MQARKKSLRPRDFPQAQRGNVVLVQTGESITKTEYNSRNEPITITDALGHQTHLSYDISFINDQGQQVLKKSTTDPLGYKTVEIFDTAGRLKESTRYNPMGAKVARQIFS